VIAMQGTLTESQHESYARTRAALLRQREWFTSGIELVEAKAECLQQASECLQREVKTHGLALAHFDRLLSNSDYIALASYFGAPMLQPNPKTQPWVDERVILNLRAEREETADVEWGLLFAENFIVLHTELALKPAAQQPRYILLLCVEPPLPDAGGQTIVVPMDAVARGLVPAHARALCRIHYARIPDAPPFLRIEDGRAVFSIRDPGGAALEWKYDDGDESCAGVDGVNAAIRSFLTALYDPDIIRGIPWQRNLLAVIDNRRVFHGRTFGGRPLNGGAPRHLRRIRVSRDA